MLLQSLVKYYEQLAEKNEAPQRGFSVAGVSFIANITEEGDLKNIVSCRENNGKKMIPRSIRVPEQIKRASGVASNFLCDNSSYVFGFDNKGKPQRSIECFNAFKELNINILKDINIPEAKAIINFLEKWDIHSAEENEKFNVYREDILKGGLFVFSLNGLSYIHDNKEIQKAWINYNKNNISENIGQCLVTGERTAIARLHPIIKGIYKGQAMGNSLISYNARAYESYGKEQGMNAPIGEYSAFAYGTTLNYLLSDSRHKAILGDTTIVFWTDSSDDNKYKDMTSLMLGFINFQNVSNEKDSSEISEPALKNVKDIFQNISDGKPFIEPEWENVKIYILGLSPNAARLSVRFFWRNTFADFTSNLMRHYQDLKIVKQFDNELEEIPVYKILSETVSENSSDKMSSPLLSASVMESILNGTKYPEALYNSILMRIKAEKNINYYKAAIIKACLLRKNRINKNKVNNEEVLRVSRNEESCDKAYVLGRLFAVLEKTQKDSNEGRLNSTIKDRYFSSACATPGVIFPRLLQLSNHHTAKMEYGYSYEKIKGDIMDKLEVDGNPFPRILTNEEQGKFILGYYHENKYQYTKKEEK